MNITCENCRQVYSTDQAFCPNCAQANKYYVKPKAQEPPVQTVYTTTPESTYTPSSSTPVEGDTFIYAIIGFFFWFVGIILYFALINTRPKAAQSALNGSLTAIVVGVILVFLASI
jgi:hypothetical protein